jgi:AAA family ATP:ADP antiporter
MTHRSTFVTNPLHSAFHRRGKGEHLIRKNRNLLPCRKETCSVPHRTGGLRCCHNIGNENLYEGQLGSELAAPGRVDFSDQSQRLALSSYPTVPFPQQLPSSQGALSLLATAIAATLGQWFGKLAKRNKKEEDVLSQQYLQANGSAGSTDGSASIGADGIAKALPPKNELKKILPLGIMFFMILFNYTILRDTKDVLVVTTTGAEIIPFLKTYANLPGAVLFTIAYSKLSNMFDRETLFYVCIIPFILFFVSFAFVIYPLRHALHPYAFVDWLGSYLPASFFAPLGIIRNWTFALFYTLAELWGSVVVSLLFWGFANEVTSVDEAKKYYPLFGLVANVALIFSGQYVRFVSDIRRKLPPGVDGWGVSLKYLMTIIGIAGSVILLAMLYIQKQVLTDPNCVDMTKRKNTKQKTKLGLKESAIYLAKSSYIRNLALLVIAYGMSINIVEVSWKSKLKEAFPDPNSYSTFMGWFSTCTGSFTLIMMLLGRFIFRKFGWGFAALITPTVLGITGFLFFCLTLFSNQLYPIVGMLGTTPLMLAVLVGAAQNILSKSSKYSLFDPCKEMAYIPLDAEQKSKGKAAIDVIGNPMGKSGGSFIQQGLIFAVGSLAASTPYLAVVLFVIVSMWIAAARSLDKQFQEAMKRSEVAEVMERTGIQDPIEAAKVAKESKQ